MNEVNATLRSASVKRGNRYKNYPAIISTKDIRHINWVLLIGILGQRVIRLNILVFVPGFDLSQNDLDTVVVNFNSK